MPNLRVPIQVFAVLYGLFAALLAMVGSFADGGDTLSRTVVSFVHPASAVGLLGAVFMPTLGKPVIALAAAVLLLTVLGDAYVAILIANGDIKGDWQLPAILAVPPAIGFLITLALLRMPAQSGDDG